MKINKNNQHPNKSDKSKKKTQKKDDAYKDKKMEAPNEEIQEMAYELYERRGYEHGNDQADWFQAELRIRGRL